jgi:hypothetical protein
LAVAYRVSFDPTVADEVIQLPVPVTAAVVPASSSVETSLLVITSDES